MKNKRYHVSFICSGNICRSPFAEGLLRKIAQERGWQERIRVSSAGTLGSEDAPPDSTTLAMASDRGVMLLTHRSRGIDPEYVESCDLILGMSVEHVATLREGFPDHAERMFLLGSFPDQDLEGREVPDPIGQSEQVYRDAHELIVIALQPLLHRLEEQFRD